MNKKYSFFILMVGFSMVSWKTLAQCQPDACIQKISDGYTFLKTYKMEQIGAETEYSYVFSRDTNYMIAVCSSSGPDATVKVTLYDASRKEIASNLDKKSNKLYSVIAYQCKATGIYYLKYTPVNQDKTDCCVSVLGFKK
ncbi:MAG TPA: hypothetical protein VK750_05605 [Cytophagaceae bacterium]|jgi:hypothetical protein|nr:hypothetical protein [Cytophagaceae bacterium]